MSYLRNLISGILVANLVPLGSGCQQTKYQDSEVLHEDAIVEDVIYTPSSHGGGAGPTFNSNGDIGISVVSVHVSQNYAVVFRCQHGKFVIEGTPDEYKDLWSRMVKGDTVDVTYKEKYRDTYDDINKDGKKEIIERVLLDYDFLDARKK